MHVRRLIRDKKYSEALLVVYKNIPVKLYRAGLIETRYPTLREVGSVFKAWIASGKLSAVAGEKDEEDENNKKRKHEVRYKAPGINNEETETLMKLLEKAAFAPDIFTEAEYRTGRGLVRKIRFRRAL
ncbi:MAG: hypothetical protein BWY61_01440 [Firmicutes bacterium ADurb.Bin354]|nr:MAG: hypothetical protein BWY61_01440 [Firmicutes bacterium ADurb.Bin354]